MLLPPVFLEHQHSEAPPFLLFYMMLEEFKITWGL